MKILKNRDESGWITAIISGRWVEAKVYERPSKFGVNNGRVSKIAISKTHERKRGQNFFDQMDYNYDRGLDFDNLPDGILDQVLSELEAI